MLRLPLKVKKATTGIYHNISIHVHCADVGPFVEETNRQEKVVMWPKGGPLQVKKVTKENWMGFQQQNQ